MFEKYKKHVIDQAVVLLKAHPTIKCLFTTPKLLEALCERVSLKAHGITGIFCGGTEMTPQFHRFAVEELCEGAYFAPTYGNTLMGLATHRETGPAEDWAIVYYPPAPRAMIEVVDPDNPKQVVDYGATGRVRLTTLTKEFFVPRFLERDSAEREPPCAKYPWDGVRNVRPFAKLGTVGRRRGVLMPAPNARCPAPADPAQGPAVQEPRRRHGGPLPDARADRRGEPGQPRADPPRPARSGRPARGAGASCPSASWSRCRSAPRSCSSKATLPLDPFAGITQTPDDYVRPAVRDDRHAARPRAPQHAQGARRAGPGRRGARRPDARPRSVAARHRDRHGRRAGDQLLPARRLDGRRAAQQLARRPLAVGADDGAQDPARPEAGQRRAVDAVPHDPGVARRGMPARGVQLLPERSRRRQRDPAPHRPRHGVRRRQGRPSAGARKAAASRCTVRASARWSSAPTRWPTGSSTSTRSRRRSPTTAAARASTRPACG